MIEEIILNYLASNISVPVYMEMPEEQPDEFVIIEKTGSGRVNYINHATFALQSYAPTMYGAAALNNQVKMVMDDAILLQDISRSEMNSDYNYTSTADKSYRYQAVYEITY